jgi:hypothetical protein
MYIAIIGDVKSSKTLNNRNEVQEKLKKTLNDVNSLYSENIAAKFLITLGDEFQGLLFYTEKIVKIIKYIQREMYPVKIRFGVGIGEISTKINKDAAIGADGPAFYAARNTISMIHDCEKKIKKQAPDIQVNKYDDDIFEITEINTLLSLIKAIEDSWTEKQRYTIWDMIVNQGSQESCALRLNTSQSTIARRLADGKYVVYINALKIIEEAIGKLEENGVI